MLAPMNAPEPTPATDVPANTPETLATPTDAPPRPQQPRNPLHGVTLESMVKALADLQYGRIDEILTTGLHAFLTQFLDRVNDLGGGIGRDFLASSGS